MTAGKEIRRNVSKKTGEEHFYLGEEKLDLKLIDFWSWSQSDLLNNSLRGVLAEFIVASALNIDDGVRVEWDAYDLITQKGLKIEVKSSAMTFINALSGGILDKKSKKQIEALL